jgi:hypothetical protein
MNQKLQRIIEDDGTPEIANQVSITQINDRDREHLRAFPAHRKAQVMKQIGSRAPAQSVVYRGKNEYEKAVLNLHRDGYGLIDMQPQELLFTTVWYRKDRSFLSTGADVTMLLWEDGGNDDDDSTTMTNWRI